MQHYTSSVLQPARNACGWKCWNKSKESKQLKTKSEHQLWQIKKTWKYVYTSYVQTAAPMRPSRRFCGVQFRFFRCSQTILRSFS